MAEFADLEVDLHRRDAKMYTIEARLTMPNSDGDIRFGQDKPIMMELDPLDFDGLIAVPDEYGKELGKRFFGDEGMRQLWAQALTLAQSKSLQLRVRLVIGSGAGELNSIYWETLRDDQGSPLFTSENLLFSRYLSSKDMRPIKLRSKGDLRALVCVANPAGLEESKLAPVDVPGEIDRAKEALGDIAITLVPAVDGERCSLETIMERLRDGCDILYFAGHGTLANGEPFLWLEDADGKVDRIRAMELVTRIRELTVQPRLVVLASCQSAGKGAGDSLQALGPQLAQAGIPAVIAMQGNISMDSVRKFMPVFFKELQRDGQIDRSLAVARGTVRDRHDFWMPVLFMRLQSGRIWFVAGFGEDGKDFEKWPSIMNALQRKAVVPVLGPGLLEDYYGQHSDIATQWAEEFRFAMSPHQRSMLPLVAQYIGIQQTRAFPYDALENHVQKVLATRFGSILPDELKNPGAGGAAAADDPFADPFADPAPAAAGGQTSATDQMLLKVGEHLRGKDPNEQHKLLASLPLQIYITTNFDTLMEDALRAAGKNPVSVICPWKESLKEAAQVGSTVMPSVEQPMVYHLFGRWDVRDSMVLTQDDYFDFMAGKTKLNELIPARVRAAIANGALLFAGFSMNDWSFRVFFRAMIDDDVRKRTPAFPRFGIQLALTEENTINPTLARNYIEKYFANDKFDIYWGDSEDFLKDLAAQWAKVAK